MSIFGKLFNKGEKKKDEKAEQKPERITMKTSLGTFYYINGNPEEIGYEGELNWYDIPEDPEKRDRYQPAGCYFDTETPDATDGSLCYEKLAAIFADRYMTDTRVKLDVISHFGAEEGLFIPGYDRFFSKDELMDDLKICFISVYRDGRIVYSLDQHYLLRDERGAGTDIHVTYEENGNVLFQGDREFYKFL
ncbi:MAG: hypothetical protein J5883_06605 [Clostridiales bacterium]|nr:hypothetical protein [Clostridiales bacterium]